MDPGDKITTLTNSANENESINSVETRHQEPSSSKSPENCNQSQSYNSTNSSVPDIVSTDSSLSAVQNNVSHMNKKPVKTAEVQNSGAKTLNSKVISEKKINPDDGDQKISNFQPALSKTNLPTINSKENLCANTNSQITTSKAPQKESVKPIDLSSLSAVLGDEENKDKKSSAGSTDEKLKSNSDQKQLNTSN